MRNLILITTLIFLIAACGPVTPPPDQPISSDDPQPSVPASYDPQPGDDQLLRSPAYVEGYDLLTMESFPPQFALTIKGNLPTPCKQLRVVVAKPDANNQIAIAIYAVGDPNVMCAEVLQPFEANINLGSFPAGHYIILINGEAIAEFDA